MHWFFVSPSLRPVVEVIILCKNSKFINSQEIIKRSLFTSESPLLVITPAVAITSIVVCHDAACEDVELWKLNMHRVELDSQTANSRYLA